MEGTDFLNQPGFHHPPYPAVDAWGEEFGGPVEAYQEAVRAGAAVPLLLVLGDGLAGLAEDLQGPDGAALVVGVDPGRGRGVHPLEFPAERREAHGPELVAEGGVGVGALEQSFQEGLDVEVGAADEDGGAATRLDVGDGPVGGGEPVGDGEAAGGLGDVDHVVGDAAAVVRGGLGGADVHAPEDLDGVGGDDLGGAGVAAAEEEGDLNGEVGFAAGGGAGDDGEAGREWGHGRSVDLATRQPPARPRRALLGLWVASLWISGISATSVGDSWYAALVRQLC